MRDFFKFMILIIFSSFIFSCLGGGGSGEGENGNFVFKLPEGPSSSCDYCIPDGAFFVCEEVREMMEMLNQIRSEVGVSPLEWDCQLAEAAQKWADYMAKNDLFEHDNNNEVYRYGENIYMFSCTGNGCSIPSNILKEALKSWYKEKSKFNYGDDWCKNFNEVGHYTQLVWKKTTKVGCGAALKEEDNSVKVYVSCKFFPAGNICSDLPY